VKTKNKRQGFSLIEVLIVLAVLAVLYLLIFPTIISQLAKANDARRKLDFNLIAKSLEQAYDSIGYYPQTLPVCDQPLILNGNNYLTSIPCDPKTKIAYFYQSDGSENSSWFKLYARLERSDDKTIDMIGCRYGCGPDCKYNLGVSSPNIGLDYCLPDVTPTPIPTGPTSIPSTPTPILYACSPSASSGGHCEIYDDPALSECPKVYPNDPTCAGECGVKENRCQNAKGKHTPE